MPADWKKIFTNHVSDEGLIFKIHKELIQLNNLKIFLNGQKNINRHFSKYDIKMVNRHMRRCSTPLIIREIQVKTTTKYHLIPVKMAIKRQQVTVRAWRKRNP